MLVHVVDCSCRYPVVRLAIAASPLQLHLSPYRYQQLMTVLQSAMAPEEGAGTAQAASSAAAAAGDKPLWMSEAEHAAKVGRSRQCWFALCKGLKHTEAFLCKDAVCTGAVNKNTEGDEVMKCPVGVW